MLNKKRIKYALIGTMFVTSFQSSAAIISREGNILRTLTGQYYGQCMALLDVSISSGCPSSGWVSLDCKGSFYSKDEADKKYSTVLAAALAKKRVLVVIDNTKKHNGYCVARRVDLMAN